MFDGVFCFDSMINSNDFIICAVIRVLRLVGCIVFSVAYFFETQHWNSYKTTPDDVVQRIKSIDRLQIIFYSSFCFLIRERRESFFYTSVASHFDDV